MMSTPLNAKNVDAAALADELVRHKLLSADHLNSILANFTGQSALELSDYLVKHKFLSQFQTESVVAGKVRLLALGKYRALDLDGNGTLGPMIRARIVNQNGEQIYRLRALPLRSLWQARQAKQTVRVLAAIPPHPTLINLCDVDSSNGLHYLAWPYFDGVRLDEHIASKGPMPASDVIILLAQLSAGLAHCHNHGVVHGMLSSTSVLLSKESSNLAAIAEFGAGMLLSENLSNEESIFDTLTSASAISMLLPFAAPEWLIEPCKLTPAIDQYALGKLAFFALTGQKLAHNEDSTHRWLKTQNLAVELTSAIDTMLQKDPDDRFPDLNEVRELFVALSGRQQLLEMLCPSSVEQQPSQLNRLDSVGKVNPISWAGNEDGLRPVVRDDSDASIRFDLPVSDEQIVPVDRSSHSQEAVVARKPLTSDEKLARISESMLREKFPNVGIAFEAEVETPRKYSSDTRISASVNLEKRAKKQLEERKEERKKLPTPPPLETEASFYKAPDDKDRHGRVWSAVRRHVSFWRSSGDSVQISVYGPSFTSRSQSARILIYLHSPSASNSVATLVRAFEHKAQHLAANSIQVELARGSYLAAHLAIANIAVANPLQSLTWRGQPLRLDFELTVPWEAALGITNGVVSIGRDDVRIGRVDFQLQIKDS